MFTGKYTFEYSVKGVEPYILEVDYSFSGGTVNFVGANMTRRNGRYYGYWAEQQWPRALIKQIRHDIREAMANIDWGVSAVPVDYDDGELPLQVTDEDDSAD